MIKKINGSNDLIISHIADIDGMGGVILAKLIDKDIDYILCEPGNILDVLKEINPSSYNNIYITDLSLSNEETYKYIDDNFNNVLHFDHHKFKSSIDYKWSNVYIEKNNLLASGTSLFYEYLCCRYPDNKYLNSSYVKSFVEDIRGYDTWDFKRTGNLDGKRLTEIFSVIGINDFLDRYYNRITENYMNDCFTFNDNEISIIEKKEQEVKDYVDACDKNLIITEFLGHKVGVSISEEYRSEVGNVLSSRHKDLDFILIANFVRGSFSFRTTNDIDLNEVAGLIGGGGHDKAAGAIMNDENVDLFFKCLIKKRR